MELHNHNFDGDSGAKLLGILTHEPPLPLSSGLRQAKHSIRNGMYLSQKSLLNIENHSQNYCALRIDDGVLSWEIGCIFALLFDLLYPEMVVSR